MGSSTPADFYFVFVEQNKAERKVTGAVRR
jgi:hypothetical protein